MIRSRENNHKRLRKVLMPFIGPRAVAQAHGVYLAAAEQSPTSLVSLIVLPEHGHEIDALEMVNRLT